MCVCVCLCVCVRWYELLNPFLDAALKAHAALHLPAS